MPSSRYQQIILVDDCVNRWVYTVTLEVDPAGSGSWMHYKEISIPKGKQVKFTFPEEFQAGWIRVVADKDCKGTAWLEYK